MHAYSLDDFLADLERDVKKNAVLLFDVDAALYKNNAIEFVLRKHGTYWRQTAETLEVLGKLDPTFLRVIKEMSLANSLHKRLSFARKLRMHLSKRYSCVLPKTWRVS